MYYKECILKYSLIFKEILCSIFTSFSLGFLLFYLIKLRFTNFDVSNQVFLQIDYKIERENNKYYNIKINALNGWEIKENVIQNSSESSSTIILSKEWYKEQLNLNEALKSINLEECFFFGKEKLYDVKNVMNILDKITSDFYDISIGITLLIFSFSMKINLFFDFIMNIQNLSKNWQKIRFSPFFTISFFYNYIISFFFFINLKPMYKIYFDYKFEKCFGFNDDAFENYYYDRRFIRYINTVNILVNNDEKNNYEFILNSKNNFFLLKDNFKTYNIIYLCMIIIISKSFIILENNKKTIFTIYKNYDSFVNKAISILNLSFLIFLWLAFIIYGVLYYYDQIYFYLRLIMYNGYAEFYLWFKIIATAISFLLYIVILVISIINKILTINETIKQAEDELSLESSDKSEDLSLKKVFSLKTCFLEDVSKQDPFV